MLCVDLGIKGYSGSASCASVASAVALGDAYRLIAHGYMDRILYGGVDYNVSSNVITQGMEAFGALCTTYNDKPEDACMPFDKKRCGTVIGDGGAFLILESEEAALKRNAKKIYGEVAGVG
jgi:3-oxoacyl-[acyl-carrier-protein] synthase II